ncbi:hypothetical protein TWF569_000161 [Orbilia oligospora]|uniref:VWFA domain-containing protein n=1 Tax=Orbilia oligospora TaxID=2813651 RepID=A0A7C8PCN2_ORBOL|nr:hypothetical protein TWF703_000120 [Orbilia oligospora]KAF3157597.1 hypothetical protein TWF569_000161 [Orbilia oligospora]
MPELVRKRAQRDARGEISQAKLIIEMPQQQKVTSPRPCRVTLGVDVSSSMTHLINAVIGGIEGVNSVLSDGDLVSVRSFAASVQTLFPYINREKVDWTRLRDNLQGLVTGRIERRDGTALWDAIVQIVQQTPRNKEFQSYKPEIVIFTDGQENRSQNNTFADVQTCLEKPGIPHVHITIIDASHGGNPQLRDVCARIQHCSYVQVEASQEAIQRAFQSTVTNINTRLELSLGVSGTSIIEDALRQVRISPGALPSIIVEETRGESSRGRVENLQQGRSNSAGRNRSKSRAKNYGGGRGNRAGNSQRGEGKDQKNGGNGYTGGGNKGNGEGSGANSWRDNHKCGGRSGGSSGGGSGGNNTGKGNKGNGEGSGGNSWRDNHKSGGGTGGGSGGNNTGKGKKTDKSWN